ncbi:HNH endonuclease signature motif containing protein [Bowdeniella nasicola]|uniref:HNH endonuclease n=1 Tax=Bowdeniella nasicola TaxID=208480 RepID=UPI0009FAA008
MSDVHATDDDLNYRATPLCGTQLFTHERYCEQHAKAEDARYRRYQRDPKINARYGSRWRKIRAAYVAAHPLCEDCLEAGRYTPVAEVHHVHPLEYGGTHGPSKLRSLCTPCHSRQTALDDDRWRQAPRVYTY